VTKTVILSSFHSQSIDYLPEYSPEAIVSFDSHLDDHMSGGQKVSEVFKKIPILDRDALERASVQWKLRLYFPKTPRYLVIPGSCYLNDLYVTARNLGVGEPEANMKFVEKRKKDLLKNLFGTQVFHSPPRNIKSLLKSVCKYTTAFDIDVDYMREFQDSCFTVAPKLEIDDVDCTSLGSLDIVKQAIHRVKPKIIVISEITPSKVEANIGHVKELFDWLKRRGYEIESGELIETDEEAFKVIKKADYFTGVVLPHTRFNSLNKNPEGIEFLKMLDESFASALNNYYLNE